MLADLVRSATVDVLADHGLDPATVPATVTITRPRDPARGDYATNVALQTGKRAGVPPRELAGWLAQALGRRRGIRTAEVAGPGFLNLRLAVEASSAIVADVLAAGEGFGALQGRPTPRLAGLEELPTVCEAQYVHARLAALARHAADLGISWEGAQVELLEHQREGELIRVLGEFPRIVAGAYPASPAAPGLETSPPGDPLRLVRYLEQLSSAYHRFDASCRMLPKGDEAPSPRYPARLALCAATRQVLANALGLLGASVPERM